MLEQKVNLLKMLEEDDKYDQFHCCDLIYLCLYSFKMHKLSSFMYRYAIRNLVKKISWF